MKEKFNYTYTAPTEREREEIEDIRKRYLPEEKDESPIARLRTLDGRVKRIPTAVAISMGVIGVLLFGTGLTLVLEFDNTLSGAIVSFFGALPTVAAYFAYKKLFAFYKRKHADEIIKITDDLLNNPEKKNSDEI